MRFQVGDTVRITKGFTDLEDEAAYPNDRNGKVTEIRENGTYPVRVMFDEIDYNELNEEHSEFRESELRLVRRG